ncbi:MAG: carbohydrate binding domain-containing protein [Candidatus Delongbacteria bacterium]|nr:carbohydrate binding domain-containing protein [Candidatus Delongbacteria bacterium]MCG2759622.1 carbohydrate binding domain-containing protein [Candidatus Delongbacteria bacterium]
MNRFIVLISAVTVIVFLSGCKPMSETVYDETAGLNGSFEVTKSGLPVNWLIYTPKTVDNSDFDLILDMSEYKDGKQSLKFQVRGCTAGGGWNSPGFCKEYEAVPGASYVISFWVKNNESEFFVRVGGVSAFDGKYEKIVRSSEKIDSWKYYEHKYTMPKEEKFNRFRFELNVLSKGSFWIDDIKIVGSDGKSLDPTSR